MMGFEIYKYLICLFALGAIVSGEAFACSPVNHDLLIESIIVQSRWYWVFNSVLALGVIAIALKSKNILLIALSVSGVAFHPSWTITPMYTASCEGMSVTYSKILLWLYIITFAYLAVKYTLIKVKSHTINRVNNA